jgi:hypothetical protein
VKRIYLFACIFALCLSCNNENKDKSEPIEASQANKSAVIEALTPSTQGTLDTHKNLLQMIKENDNEIYDDAYYISKLKIELDRETYLVAWGNIEIPKKSAFVKIYSIRNNKIDTIYDLIHVDNQNKVVSFDIMKDIPGERIGQGMAAIYDYNHDGFDEIVFLEFSGMGNYFWIIGYDKNEDEMINYTPELRFRLDDPVNGPAPVRYMEYNGYWGFFVNEDNEYNSQSFWFYYPENRQYYSWDYSTEEERTQ